MKQIYGGKNMVTKKTVKKAVAKRGKISVGHFDGALTEIDVIGSDTLEKAFEKAGIKLEDYEDAEINTLNAQTVSPKAKVKPGMTYLLSGNYDNGL